MKCHEAGVDRNGHRGKMKIIEEHRQMIVKTLRGCEVQLQRPEKERPIDHIAYRRLNVAALSRNYYRSVRPNSKQFANKYPTDV